MNPVVQQLQQIVEPNSILLGDAVRSRIERIWTTHCVQASAIVRPRTTEEVSAVLRCCYENDQTVVTHGGLTGLVDGALTKSSDIALSTERINQIEDINPQNRTMTVQAGAKLQQVQEAAERHGLMFALDLGARGSCTIGGNISTNAGGNRVIRYGMMRDMVLGVEAVLADGTVLTSLNDIIKNNAGYDLKHLFIGTEGTLGIVTRAILRLREEPLSDESAFIAVDDFDKIPLLLKSLDRQLGGNLTSFEVMWNDFYSHIIETNSEHTPPLPVGSPYYILVEAWGGNQQLDRERMEQALSKVYEDGLATDIVIAQNKAQSKTFWAIRDDVEQLMCDLPAYVFDVSLRINDAKNYVAEVNRLLKEKFGFYRIYTFGHLGDGNIHFVIHVGTDCSSRHLVDHCVYEPLRAIRGSVSAEHGIGLEKKSYLEISRDETELHVMRSLKSTLDPKGILNPGLVF